jgi:hypothetical protein
MRQTTTAVVTMMVLGLGLPALAESHADKAKPGQATSSQMTTTEKMAMESHLKAAGYDLMQARQMIQTKDSKMTQEHLNSARQHIQMAESSAKDKNTIAGQIRRIETSLEMAERVARTDMTKAGQQVAQATVDLQKLIKEHSIQGKPSR